MWADLAALAALAPSAAPTACRRRPGRRGRRSRRSWGCCATTDPARDGGGRGGGARARGGDGPLGIHLPAGARPLPPTGPAQ
eukprot:scaffold20671_cov64-Phaeocystis_antarctica.AAC.1